MKKQRLLTLPASLSTNETANIIKSYLSKLGPHSAFFSAILYHVNNKNYFLLKDKDFPFINFDWTMYCLYRSASRSIVTSGKTLRMEPIAYGQTRADFGRKQIQQIFEHNVHDPFNLFVYTKKMNKEDIEKIVCQKYFKYIPTEQIKLHEPTLKQIIQKIGQLGMGPTIIENGDATLSQSLAQVKPQEKNYVELIILSLFEGSIPKRFIGQEYGTSILDRDFDKVWESQRVNSTAKHEDGQVKPITLKFVIYTRKNKNEHKPKQN